MNMKKFFVLSTLILFSFGCKKNEPESGSHEFNGSYSGEYLTHVTFPMGGMGAGMICLEGTGAISHVSVRNAPDIFNEPFMFSALMIKGAKNKAKVLEGPVPMRKIFGVNGAGNGLGWTTYGFPKFEKCSFTPRFPFATVRLEDKEIPVEVEIKGWSPFTPGDPDNSSMPVASLEYTFTNSGNKEVTAVFSFHSVNFMKVSTPGKTEDDEILDYPGGFILYQPGGEGTPSREGSFAAFVKGEKVVVDHCWFRSGWWDPITIAWKCIEEGTLRDTPPQDGSSPGASLYVPITLAAGESKTIPLLLTWYVPHSEIKVGQAVAPPAACCSQSEPETTYSPWYSGKFANIREVSNYWKANYESLKQQSQMFSETFFSSSLPPEVMEAIAANLTILKSPTVLRQKNGRLWSWEGCSDAGGCCHGSCTHVWNYAQAIPNLFPSLERSLRITEFNESQDSTGHQTFRATLPIALAAHTFYAAADGQLGGIMKMYREWRISGDTQWLRSMWPKVQQSMDYCIRTWDPRHKGVIEEPHHNTYDIEFWGPDGMCTSFYLGALTAFIEMSREVGTSQELYQQLLDKGKDFMRDSLFNGDYFFQRVQIKGLNAMDPVIAAQQSAGNAYSPEALEVMKKEGPNYQYGNGCLSDGVLGFWIARMCGLDEIIDPRLVKSHLASVFKFNFHEDLSDHANPQRPGFALGSEGGLILCSWPKEDQPTIPFPYCHEVWTGFEYQVASHLIMEGMVDKGLLIVRTCRQRYDGRYRNPFDEYECGHWYARAMSSYGLLQGLTGVRYDAVDKTLFLNSSVGKEFQVFLSTETGFGLAGMKEGKPFLEVKWGDIPVDHFFVAGKKMDE
jgi:uncharacterized protein (DUF608 family)